MSKLKWSISIIKKDNKSARRKLSTPDWKEYPPVFHGRYGGKAGIWIAEKPKLFGPNTINGVIKT